MTEAEAKTKWCPFAMTFGDKGVLAGNRANAGGLPTGSMCIGSECMAWCKMPMEIQPNSLMKMRPGGGFCGLAGTPQ